MALDKIEVMRRIFGRTRRPKIGCQVRVELPKHFGLTAIAPLLCCGSPSLYYPCDFFALGFWGFRACLTLLLGCGGVASIRSTR
jgi:hypothetical protein